ncbi:MAG TPA: carboxypeptidase regulatory-like domain-containing protein [Acidobacteriota bacterium]|jgi:plastocyanin
MKRYFLLLGLIAAVAIGCTKKEEPAPATESTPTAAPAAPADMANAATVTGKVTFAGTKPTPRKIRMDADKYCAAQHPGGVETEEITVNDNGTLANVLVYVKDGLNQSFQVPAQAASLDQKGCTYHPHVLAVMAGQPIDILNSDNTNHNIHPLPKMNPEWNESQAPGTAKKTKTFNREEIAIPVKCNIHPWMKSYIAVLKHPIFAITGSDGSFELKGLPPGDYTVAAWHEKLGTVDQKVTVAAKESKAVDFTLK